MSKTVLKSKIKKYTLNKLNNKENDDASESLSWRNKITNSINTPKLKNREMEVKLYRIILGYKSYEQLKNEYDFCKYCNNLYLCPLEHWTECENVTVKLNKHVNNNTEKYANLTCPEKMNYLITNHYNEFIKLIQEYPVPR